MSFAAKNHEEKPYNMCLDCVHIGKNCDGPNFLAMSIERWCEWCHLRKEYLDWTNAHVAELAGVSKISVDRVMSGNVKDLRISTMQSITKALVNGSWGQYPCAMADFTDKEVVYQDNPEMVHECNRLKSALELITAEHKAELNAAREDTEKRLQYLKDQIAFKENQMAEKDKQIAEKDKRLAERYDFLKRKDKNIAILSAMLTISVLVIIAALVVDVMNPDMGFFWLGQLFAPKGFSFTDLFGSL